MAATVKTPDSDHQPMNKLSWQAQKLIADLDVWQAWIRDSAEKFTKELTEMQVRKALPAEDQRNLQEVRAALAAHVKTFQPLEKAINKATGRRIYQARKNRPRPI